MTQASGNFVYWAITHNGAQEVQPDTAIGEVLYVNFGERVPEPSHEGRSSVIELGDILVASESSCVIKPETVGLLPKDVRGYTVNYWVSPHIAAKEGLHRARDFITGRSRRVQQPTIPSEKVMGYVEAARRCIENGELHVVRDYFLGTGLIKMSHLDVSEDIKKLLEE